MSNDQRLRLGVIGVGAMGARHAENIARGVPEATLVAVFDAQPAAAARVAGALGCDHTTSLDEWAQAGEPGQAASPAVTSPPSFTAWWSTMCARFTTACAAGLMVMKLPCSPCRLLSVPSGWWPGLAVQQKSVHRCTRRWLPTICVGHWSWPPG